MPKAQITAARKPVRAMWRELERNQTCKDEDEVLLVCKE